MSTPVGKNGGRYGPISGSVLKKSLEKLAEILGPAAKDSLVSDLEKIGMRFTSDRAYSLDEVEKALVSTFGEDGAKMLVKFIERDLAQAG